MALRNSCPLAVIPEPGYTTKVGPAGKAVASGFVSTTTDSEDEKFTSAAASCIASLM